MKKFGLHIIDRESGNIIHKYAITIEPKSGTEFYDVRIFCDDKWPPLQMYGTFVGVKSEQQGLEEAVKSIQKQNEIRNRFNGHDVDDIYEGPFPLEGSIG